MNVQINPIRDITSLGSLAFNILLILFVYTIHIPLANVLLTGSIIVYAISLTIRLFYFKRRPNKQKYTNIIERLDASSFPSIHAGRTTFIAILLAVFINNIATTILLVFTLAAVLYSRISLHKHDWKDLTAGVITGTISYYITTILPFLAPLS